MVPEARVPANIARQVGARISEILQIPEVWHTRQTDRDGVSILNVITKGGKRGSLHFGPGIARETGNNLDKHQKFIRADGRPWTRFTLSGEIRRAADSVGAKTFNFHTLRHVFASRAFQVLHLDAQTDPRNGALDPVLMVQYLLNHSSPQTTMSTYLHNFAFEPGDTIPDAEMHAVRTLFQAVPAHINHGDIQL
jgi:integrase